MPHFTHDQLHKITRAIFEVTGVPAAEAAIVADSLVDANLCGHDSHGAVRIPQYVGFIRDGDIATGVPLKIDSETETTAVIDGGWGFGQVQSRRMTEVAMNKARNAGVAVVTLHHCNHIGRVGEYLERVARAGFVAFAAVNNHGSGRSTAPYGGWEPRLATNPITFAAPVADGDPVVLDITTSVTAEGKIRVRRNKGEPVPEGWIIDNQGNFTTDANDFYTDPRGAIMPFGGEVAHKGFGLSMMVDILVGALGSGGCSRPEANRLGNAFFLTVIDPARFNGADYCRRQVADLIAWCKSSRKLPGVEEILVPGEPEARCRKHRLEHGIEIDAETWRQIEETAKGVGAKIDVPAAQS